MTMSDCPTSGALTELAAEDVDSDNICAHLEQCPKCRERYEEIRTMLAGLNLLIRSSEKTPTPLLTRRRPAVIGKYFVVGIVSERPGATTYRAVQASMQTNEYAIVLADEAWADPEAIQPVFESACGTLERLDDPSIARAEDLGLFDDRPFIAFEFVAGEPWSRVLASRPIPVREAARIGAELARALASAHGEGLVHGSFSIESIRINHAGRPVITDFAAARLLANPSSPADPAIDRASFAALLGQLAESPGLETLRPLATRSGSAALDELARSLAKLSRPSRRSTWIAAAIVALAGIAAGLWSWLGR